MRDSLRISIISLALLGSVSVVAAQRAPGVLNQQQERAVAQGLQSEPAQPSTPARPEVGSKMPSSVATKPLPANVASQVPDAKGLQFAKYIDYIVLVDPDTQIVAEIIMTDAATAAAPGTTLAQNTTSGGATGAGSAVEFILAPRPDDWEASRLVGVDIYGANNEKIGDIKEILMQRSGTATAVVIGVGGFLGIGEKNVAIPYRVVQWSDQPRGPTSASSGSTTTGTTSSAPKPWRGYPDHGVLNMTRDQLKAAPEFKRTGNAR